MKLVEDNRESVGASQKLELGCKVAAFVVERHVTVVPVTKIIVESSHLTIGSLQQLVRVGEDGPFRVIVTKTRPLCENVLDRPARGTAARGGRLL